MNVCDISVSQEEILQSLDHILERARAQFPRLYFLSDQELVELLSISRNPRGLEPTARKCFQGVFKLVYDLPVGTSSMNSALDYALNGKRPIYFVCSTFIYIFHALYLF